MQLSLLSADIPSTEDSSRSFFRDWTGGKNLPGTINPRDAASHGQSQHPRAISAAIPICSLLKKIAFLTTHLLFKSFHPAGWVITAHPSPRFVPLPWEDLSALIPTGLYQVITTVLPGSSPASCLVMDSSSTWEHVAWWTETLGGLKAQAIL